jgi:hypothetical protein
MDSQVITKYLGGLVRITKTRTQDQREVVEQTRVTFLGIPIKEVSYSRPASIIDNVVKSLSVGK